MTLSQDRNEALRIGLFGGTFDPIHLGHLAVGEAVRRHFALDRICLIPSARPPHKQTNTDARDRLAMVRLAAGARPGWDVSDIELRRRGPSYSIDTVTCIKGDSPPGTRLFFLLGSDAFLEINTWKSYTQLVATVALIVLARGGDEDATASLVARMRSFVDRHLPGGYRWDPAAGAFVHPEHHPVYLFDGPRVAISASLIRQRIAQGQDVHDLLDPAVADYIQRKGLYR